MTPRLLPCLLLFALAGCGASLLSAGSGGGGGGGKDGGGGGGGAGGGSAGGGGGADGGCPEEAKTVYVVDSSRTFSAFDPKTKTFRDIGILNCPASVNATPFSMAVDRNAVALVLYTSGELFKVSTTSLSCTKTAFSSAQYKNFGMGFSTDTVNGTADSLFISGGPGVVTTSSFARLDVGTLLPADRGTLMGWPELTGTGDAKLWGFFPSTGTTAPFVAEISKTNGALGVTFPAASITGAPNAWAFAFWGGRFWIFLKRVADSSTVVYEMNAATGVLTTALPATGRQIVGAGVSTCAPVEIN